MENKAKQETELWVEEQMALLGAPPDWEPDTVVARTRLEGRLSVRSRARTRMLLPRAAVAALACLVLIFVIPTTRALTQQLWQWLTVRKVEVVQADFERLRGHWLFPQAVYIDKDDVKASELPPRPENIDLAEAARRAGFTPRLPHEGVPTHAPNVATMGPAVWSIILNAADLELSLRQAGVDDQPIPKEWDGAQVSMHLISAISVSWPGTDGGGEGFMNLVQQPPITLSAPPGFDFVKYWTAALRAAGVSREQAQKLGERLKTEPTLLLGIVTKNKVAIREVNLRTGPATLIEHIDWTGKTERISLFWSVSDRTYMLDASSEKQAISAANSIE